MAVRDLSRMADRIRTAARVTETITAAIRIAAVNLADSTGKSTASTKNLLPRRRSFAEKSPGTVTRIAIKTTDRGAITMRSAERSRSVSSTLRRAAAEDVRSSRSSRSRKKR